MAVLSFALCIWTFFSAILTAIVLHEYEVNRAFEARMRRIYGAQDWRAEQRRIRGW